MAKQKNTPAPVEPATDAALDASDSPPAAADAVNEAGEELGQVGEQSDAAAAVADAQADEGDDSDAVNALAADVETVLNSGEPEPSPGETVPALVLSDNHLGKVGQVIQVEAAHAEALRLGGLIDPHPNAIASVAQEA
ncbi:hypothetical protein JY438_02615 [Stenotrophomonas maltophilia]|nr:hypothetical protein [Stenotrophomonas maltophilia]